MALFLAAFGLQNRPVSDTLARSLQSILGGAGRVGLRHEGTCAIAYRDLGLWPGASTLSSVDAFAVVGGDPVQCDGEQAEPRSRAIAGLMQRLSADDEGVLCEAEGTFAGLVMDRSGTRLQAFTDKAGVRPIYWAQTPHYVFAASSYWALRTLPGLELRPDWRAAAETAAFGFPLGNRTLVEPIQLLGVGHRLCADVCGVRSQPYWDWSTVTPNGLQGQALLAHVERAFHAAVDRRCEGQARVMAFLSGGMDSRIIVSRLRERGLRVHSLNFAPEGSQDLAFGRMAAKCLSCDHFEFGKDDPVVEFAARQTAAFEAWNRANPNIRDRPEQPGLVWSGDGGSVGLGHVYLSSSAVAMARTQGLEAAARHLQRTNKNEISGHLLRRQWKHLAAVPLQGIIEDLRSRIGLEAGRNCHMFFMLNDQRRHLAEHFETIHTRGVDLVLPFFDGRFLAAVLASRVDEFLEHRLYNDLMTRLPEGAGQIPWQAYPGHVPCPAPIEPGLRRQWEEGWFERGIAKKHHAAKLRQLGCDLGDCGLACQVLNRPLLRGVALAASLGFGRFGYLLGASEPFVTAARHARAAQA